MITVTYLPVEPGDRIMMISGKRYMFPYGKGRSVPPDVAEVCQAHNDRVGSPVFRFGEGGKFVHLGLVDTDPASSHTDESEASPASVRPHRNRKKAAKWR